MTEETQQLSRFLAETTFEDLPDEVIHEAKRMIMDTIGVSIAGMESDAVELSDTVCRDASATFPTGRVLGSGADGRITDAAFVNGVMGHVLDFDDMHARLGGHPSVPVLPVVLALGEARSASGAEVIRAFALGTEVETLLGDVLNPGHYSQGWHPTAVIGQIGAAVAAGALHEFSEDEFARVIGLAASKSSGIKGNFGTMTKSYHVGDAARGGIEAARLVADGFTASESILEDDTAGFCTLFQGDPPYDFGDRFEAINNFWGVVNPPPSFKPYPCCGSTHAPIDAALELRKRHDLTLDTIKRVDIVEHPRRLPHTDRPEPTTGLAGKFSVQYVVSRALRDGDIWLDDFTTEAVKDPEIQEFLKKVYVEGDQAVDSRVDTVPGAIHADWEQWDTRFTGQVPRKKHAYLRVETESNEVHESYIDAPTGTPPNPMTDEQLQEKFRRCTQPYLPKAQVERSLSVIEDLASIDDISILIDELI